MGVKLDFEYRLLWRCSRFLTMLKVDVLILTEKEVVRIRVVPTRLPMVHTVWFSAKTALHRQNIAKTTVH